MYQSETIRVGYLGINLFGNVFFLLYCHLMFDLTNMLQLLVKRCCKLVATGQLVLKVTASKFKQVAPETQQMLHENTTG